MAEEKLSGAPAKAASEANAKKTNEAVKRTEGREYNTSAAGLGALAAKLAAKKVLPRPTPDATMVAPTPAPTSVSINTPHDLGGTPARPRPTPYKDE